MAVGKQGMKRRVFLQRTGLVLAALGVGDGGLSVAAERYYQVLAKPTGRKLALLVGINQYSNATYDLGLPSSSPNAAALSGCVTDVDLQRELLQHRFGFRDRDILTLTDQQATRANIETAFLDHLINQARADDVVVFHFSGYGSQLIPLANPNQSSPVPLSPAYTLVPADGRLPTDDELISNDWLLDTLALLLRSLPTDQVTTVLDVGFSVPPIASASSSLKVRTRPSVPTGRWHPDELQLQANLQRRIKALPTASPTASIFEQMPGVVLLAGAPGCRVAEIPYGGFTAGLFTYALTQTLWASALPTTVRVSLGQVTSSIEQSVGAGQQPMRRGQRNAAPRLLTYFAERNPVSPIASGWDSRRSRGVVGAVLSAEADGKTGQVWLGGLPLGIVDLYGAGAVLGVAVGEPSDAGADWIPAQVRAREGLIAKVQWLIAEATAAESALLQATQLQANQLQATQLQSSSLQPSLLQPSPLQPGQWVTEWVRVLPRQLNLTIGLDNSLERIERVDAISGFAAVANVTPVIAGEQAADYLFGRSQPASQTLIAASLTDASRGDEKGSAVKTNNLLVKGGYGLFSLNRTPIPTSIGDAGEAVKTAVHRVSSHLKTLLAIKCLRLTSNGQSSQVAVTASLTVIQPNTSQRLLQQATPAALALTAATRAASPEDNVGALPLTVTAGQQLQYQITNQDARPLYGLVLMVDSAEQVFAAELPAIATESTPSAADNPPGLLPNQTATLNWTVTGTSNNMETYLILSTAPFSQTWATLDPRSLGATARPYPIATPLTTAKAILQDLHNTSTPLTPKSAQSADTYALHANAWATLEFRYRVG